MPDRWDPFDSMSRLLATNTGEGFGGAFVIVPPGDDPVPISTLILDNSQDEAMFWATLQAKAKMALQAIEDRERQGGLMGLPRR